MSADLFERLLSDVTQRMTSLVVLANAAGNVTFLNESARRVIGEERARAGGLRLSDFHPPETGALLMDEAIPVVSTEGAWTGASLLVRAQGDSIPVNQTILAGRDEAGGIVGYASLMEPILGGPAEALAALRGAEERAAALAGTLEAVQEERAEHLRQLEGERQRRAELERELDALAQDVRARDEREGRLRSLLAEARTAAERAGAEATEALRAREEEGALRRRSGDEARSLRALAEALRRTVAQREEEVRGLRDELSVERGGRRSEQEAWTAERARFEAAAEVVAGREREARGAADKLLETLSVRERRVLELQAVLAAERQAREQERAAWEEERRNAQASDLGLRAEVERLGEELKTVRRAGREARTNHEQMLQSLAAKLADARRSRQELETQQRASAEAEGVRQEAARALGAELVEERRAREVERREWAVARREWEVERRAGEEAALAVRGEVERLAAEGARLAAEVERLSAEVKIRTAESESLARSKQESTGAHQRAVEAFAAELAQARREREQEGDRWGAERSALQTELGALRTELERSRRLEESSLRFRDEAVSACEAATRDAAEASTRLQVLAQDLAARDRLLTGLRAELQGAKEQYASAKEAWAAERQLAQQTQTSAVRVEAPEAAAAVAGKVPVPAGEPGAPTMLVLDRDAGVGAALRGPLAAAGVAARVCTSAAELDAALRSAGADAVELVLIDVAAAGLEGQLPSRVVSWRTRCPAAAFVFSSEPEAEAEIEAVRSVPADSTAGFLLRPVSPGSALRQLELVRRKRSRRSEAQGAEAGPRLSDFLSILSSRS